MPKLDLRNATRIKAAGGELVALKGAGFSWVRPAPLPLDTLSVAAAAAYSLRRLWTGYTGPAIRVRRSNDNAEVNIGFTAAGGLDTAALLAHVGAGNGFVTTWYDQSGNGRNAVQATAAAQPRIVNAGVVETQGERPIARFLGTQKLVTSAFASGVSQFHALIVARLDAVGSFPRFLSVLSDGNSLDFDNTFSVIPFLMDAGSAALIGNWRFGPRAIGTIALGTPFVGSSWFDAANANLAINGGAINASAFAASALGSTVRLGVGGRVEESEAALHGAISEVVWFHSALPTTDRQALERNQGVYYGITVT